MREWVKDLIWFVAIVVALVAYARVTGVAWPIAVVSSYSMEPTLRVGDFVILAGASCETASPGDIVVYVARNPMWAGSWIIHRIYSKQVGSSCGLVTWGDNNNLPDQAVGEPLVGNNLVGKVVLTIPYVGVFPMVVRPQGIGPVALAAWMGRLALFGGLVYGFYAYFKLGEKRRRRGKGQAKLR